MTPEETALLAEQLAPRVASALLDDPRFRLMLKEIALDVHAEDQRLRREEVPRQFLAVCALSGIRLSARDGVLYLNKELPEGLERFRQLYRDEILNFVMNGPIIHTNGDSHE